MEIANLNKRIDKIRGRELLANPLNLRTHPPLQQKTVKEAIEKIGYAGTLLAYDSPDGLILIDGHLRAALFPDMVFDVAILDVTTEQGNRLLLTHDAVGGMGDYDVEQVQKLIELSHFDGPYLQALQEQLEQDAKQPFKVSQIAVESLKPHPRNYREHPEDQLAHICKSIETNGFYRNVIAARDLTVLAGHGVVLATKKLGRTHTPTIVLDLDPDEPKALKIITGDNEIAKSGEVDDRALTEMLKEIMQSDEGLIGTGFNEEQLAALAMVTRHASEVADKNEAAEWVGMPEYEAKDDPHKIIVSFENKNDKDDFFNKLGIKPYGKSMWWPPKERDDMISVAFRENANEKS